MAHILPSYMPPYDYPLPAYSTEPAEDEKRLDIGPRRLHVDQDNGGIYVKKYKKVTLVLQNQPSNAEHPVYGVRRSVIGSVHLDNTDMIRSVNIKLVGKMDALLLSCGHVSVDLCNVEQTLYTIDKRSNSPLSRSSFTFSLSLPSQFKCGTKEHNIPPSCEVDLGPGQYIKCRYTLVVTTSKARVRHRRLAAFVHSTSSFTLDILYHPRSRPSSPLPPNLRLLTSIKVCPEEWRQFFFSVPCSNNQGSIDIQIYLPSAGVFHVQDTIPFYVQLTGSLSVMQDLASQGPRICIVRQATIILGGQRYSKYFVIGEGRLKSLPPPSSQAEDSLNWEGEVCCTNSISGGGFTAGLVDVKDFITLEVPICGGSTQNQVFRRGIPAKFTTDPWVEGSIAV